MPFILLRDFGLLGVAIILAMAGIGSSKDDKSLYLIGAGVFAVIWAVIVFVIL